MSDDGVSRISEDDLVFRDFYLDVLRADREMFWKRWGDAFRAHLTHQLSQENNDAAAQPEA